MREPLASVTLVTMAAPPPREIEECLPAGYAPLTNRTSTAPLLRCRSMQRRRVGRGPRVGDACAQIVKALRLDPERVAALHEAWLRMKQPRRPLREGKVAARAFEMFAAGKSCRDVAIQRCQPAPVVLGLYRDFRSLDAADEVDLPADVLATLWRMGYRLPKRHPARAIPDLIEHVIQEIEKHDPDAIEARKANGGS